MIQQTQIESLNSLQRSTGRWNAWGHSYFNIASVCYDQNGRTDAIARDLMRISPNSWVNRAIGGSRISIASYWSHIAFNTQYRGNNPASARKTAPYTPASGGNIIYAGLNDLGHDGPAAQSMNSWLSAMRFSISRFRAATVLDNTDSSIAYGSGMVAVTKQDGASTMGTLRSATTMTNATFTITLPADYSGETIALMLIGTSGVVGGTVTWSGTAGWTGTVSTSNIKPLADATTCPVCVRGVAPVTGATQTIIGTVTQVDPSGSVMFDSWWLESKSPAPVIVCNIARLAVIYSGYTVWNTASPTVALQNADVLTWNSALGAMISNEFDSMVQIADADTAVGADITNFAAAPAPAYLHPNEIGSAKIAGTILAAYNALTAPVTSSGQVRCISAAPGTNGGIRKIIRPGHYYTVPGAKISASTYSCVAGDMFAIPLQITEASFRFDEVCINNTIASTTGTSIRVGVYFDSTIPGYPSTLYSQLSSGVSIGTTTGLKTTSCSQFLDPGLYWLVFLVNSATGTVPKLTMIDGPVPSMPDFADTGLPISGVLGPVAWKLTGQSTSSLPEFFPQTGATLVASAPAPILHSAIPG